jgi:hypothetical protein
MGLRKVDAYSAVATTVATLPPFSIAFDSSAPPQLRVEPALVGSKYILQVSTNLAFWSSISTNAAATNEVVFQPTPGATEALYYRVARRF